LLRDLEGNCREPLRGRRILLLGAGGAARGALRPLLAAEPAQLVIANRTPGRAESLMNEAATDDVGVVLAAMGLEAVRGPFDLVINATSAGLDGHSVARGLGEETLAGAFCYDMIYAPGRDPAATAFCRWARGCGARRTADGLGMLVEQAALAFLAWRGVSPATAPVLELLRPVSV
jgi:shikimate dehydrogenase